jgi:TRAP-type C4-dicarboxylate transport system substrate-binding protein
MSKNIKAAVAVVIMVTVIVALVLTGCSQPAGEVQTVTKTVTTTAAAPSGPEPVVLKFAIGEPSTVPYLYTGWRGFKYGVETESEGALQVDLYLDSTLMTMKDTQDAVSNGIAEIGLIACSYAPEKMPLAQVWGLPPLWGTAYEGTRCCETIAYDPQYGMVQEMEALNVHRLGEFILGPYEIISMKKPINTIEDLKGLRIRSNSMNTTQFYSTLGAIPSSMSASEAGDALQKGTLDASIGMAGSTLVPLGWYELGDPGYYVDIGGSPTANAILGINKDVYDGLDSKLQGVLDTMGRQYLGLGIAMALDGGNIDAARTMSSIGVVRIIWDDAEKAKMHEMTAFMADQWAADTDAKGLPGTKIVEAIRAYCE